MNNKFNVSDDEIRKIVHQHLPLEHEVLNISELIDKFIIYLKIIMNDVYHSLIDNLDDLDSYQDFLQCGKFCDSINYTIINRMIYLYSIINGNSAKYFHIEIRDNGVIDDILDQIFVIHFNNCNEIREIMLIIMCKDVVNIICDYMII